MHFCESELILRRIFQLKNTSNFRWTSSFRCFIGGILQTPFRSRRINFLFVFLVLVSLRYRILFSFLFIDDLILRNWMLIILRKIEQFFNIFVILFRIILIVFWFFELSVIQIFYWILMLHLVIRCCFIDDSHIQSRRTSTIPLSTPLSALLFLWLRKHLP